MKGIGASSFVEEEVDKLYGNEAVNSKYMAKYDEVKERVKAPDNNRDLQLLRVFIRRKYIEKAWYKNDEEKNETFVPTGPTRVKIPPKSKTGTTPTTASAKSVVQEDLLSFDVPKEQQGVRQEETWDAFGNGAQQNHFDAAFDDSPVPMNQKQQPHQLFQPNFASVQEQDNVANFANFTNNSSTIPSLSPLRQQQHQQLMQQGIMYSPSRNNNQNSSAAQFQQTPFPSFLPNFDQSTFHTNMTSFTSSTSATATTTMNQAVIPQQNQLHLTSSNMQASGLVGMNSMNQYAASSSPAIQHHHASPQSYEQPMKLIGASTTRIPSLPPVGPPPDESPPEPPASPPADDDDDFPPPSRVFSADDFSPLSSGSKFKKPDDHVDDFPPLSSGAEFGHTEEPPSAPTNTTPTTITEPVIHVHTEKKNAFDAFAHLSLKPNQEYHELSNKQTKTKVENNVKVYFDHSFAVGQEVIFSNGGGALRMKIINIDDPDNNYTVSMKANKDTLFRLEDYQDNEETTAIMVSKADYSLVDKVKQLPQDKKMLIEKFINAL